LRVGPLRRSQAGNAASLFCGMICGGGTILGGNGGGVDFGTIRGEVVFFVAVVSLGRLVCRWKRFLKAPNKEDV